MKSGRTIAGKREKLETESERTRVRKHLRKKHAWTVTGVIVLSAILLALFVLGVKNLVAAVQERENSAVVTETHTPQAAIVDESGNAQVTSRMREYIWQIENDLYDLGYVVTRAVLPAGMMREVDLYLDGYSGYFKASIDRDTAVTAEDIDRMVRYLGENEFTYVDVRIAGKAYWK